LPRRILTENDISQFVRLRYIAGSLGLKIIPEILAIHIVIIAHQCRLMPAIYHVWKTSA